MKEELSLRELVVEVILFLIKYKFLICVITLLVAIVTYTDSALEDKYYSTTAIASSGIVDFERDNNKSSITTQSTAINMINNLQLDIQKEDFSVVGKKLGVSNGIAAGIINISANQLSVGDKKEEKKYVSKFTIDLKIRNKDVIADIENGLLYYFNTNKYVKEYYELFLISNDLEIHEIDNEVTLLRELRSSILSIDMSTTNIGSAIQNKKVNNAIIELIQLKSVKLMNQELLKPLVFVQGFSISSFGNRDFVKVWKSTFFGFIFSIIIALFINVYKNHNS